MELFPEGPWNSLVSVDFSTPEIHRHILLTELGQFGFIIMIRIILVMIVIILEPTPWLRPTEYCQDLRHEQVATHLEGAWGGRPHHHH